MAAAEKENGMGPWKCSQPGQKQISGLPPAPKAEERAHPHARAPEELAPASSADSSSQGPERSEHTACVYEVNRSGQEQARTFQLNSI